MSVCLSLSLSQVPGPWVALMAGFMDLVGTGVRLTSLEEVQTMAAGVDLPEDQVPLVLHYLNQQGLITWFDDPQLRRLVVLVSSPLS